MRGPADPDYPKRPLDINPGPGQYNIRKEIKEYGQPINDGYLDDLRAFEKVTDAPAWK